MSPFNIPTTYINFKWLLPDIQNIFSFQQDVTIQLQYITSSSWLIFPTLKCMTVWCPVLGSRSIQTDEGRKDRMRRSVPKVAQAGTCPACPTGRLCPPSLRTARGRCPMFPLSFKMSTSPILSKVGGVFSYLFTTKFRCHHKSQNFVHTRKHIFVWEGVRLIKVRLKYHVYFGVDTAHICHNQRWCSFFPQRMWNQQPYSENKSPTLHTFVMKLTDTSSKIPNIWRAISLDDTTCTLNLSRLYCEILQ